MRSVQQQPATPDYGIDAPPRVFTLVILAFFSVMAGIFIGSGMENAAVVVPFAVLAMALAGAAAAMVASAKIGKGRLWDRVLDDLDLDGTERALDVACGRGLVLVKLARRLDRHPVDGIDLWRAADQSGNRPEVARGNAAVEGVAGRVAVHTGDMRTLPFADDTYDLVTVSLALRLLPDPATRRRAIDEIMRVLRPGGRAVILDTGKTAELAAALRDAGCSEVTRSGLRFGTFPPSRVVTAHADGSSPGS